MKKEKEPNFSGDFVCYDRLSVEICPQYRREFPLQFTRTINGYVDCHPVGIVKFIREMPGSLTSLTLRDPHEFIKSFLIYQWVMILSTPGSISEIDRKSSSFARKIKKISALHGTYPKTTHINTHAYLCVFKRHFVGIPQSLTLFSTASDARNRQFERVETEARRVEEESTLQMATLRKLLEEKSSLTL